MSRIACGEMLRANRYSEMPHQAMIPAPNNSPIASRRRKLSVDFFFTGGTDAFTERRRVGIESKSPLTRRFGASPCYLAYSASLKVGVGGTWVEKLDVAYFLGSNEGARIGSRRPSSDWC